MLGNIIDILQTGSGEYIMVTEDGETLLNLFKEVNSLTGKFTNCGSKVIYEQEPPDWDDYQSVLCWAVDKALVDLFFKGRFMADVTFRHNLTKYTGWNVKLATRINNILDLNSGNLLSETSFGEAKKLYLGFYNKS